MAVRTSGGPAARPVQSERAADETESHPTPRREEERRACRASRPRRRRGAASAARIVVNDFSLQVATANGSGSQTANNVLMRSIFRMGVPVSGKNLFPSNIQGLPTWFTIRANRDGYIARKRELDVLVLMNPETADEDVRAARPGAHRSSARRSSASRRSASDLRFYPVPFSELVVKVTAGSDQAKLRKLDRQHDLRRRRGRPDGDRARPRSRRRSAKQLRGKQKAIDLNLAAMRLGLEYAAANFSGEDPLPRRADGRDGAARSSSRGTPPRRSAASSAARRSAAGIRSPRPPRSARPSSTSATTTASTRRPGSRRSPSSRPRTRSPRSAWSSAPAGRARAPSRPPRARASRSCPSSIGLGYYTEVPAVVWDVQRVGPSTGLPTRTMQGDLLLAYYNSHGDTQPPGPLPRLARGVLRDGDGRLRPRRGAPDARLRPLGPRPRDEQLDVRSVPVPDAPAEGGKGPRRGVGRAAEGRPGAATRTSTATASRTGRSPGRRARSRPTSRAARGTTRWRSTPRSRTTTSTNVDRLARKFETARTMVPKPEIDDRFGVAGGLLAFGTSHYGDGSRRATGSTREFGRRARLPAPPRAPARAARSATGSTGTSGSTSSSRTATPSSGRSSATSSRTSPTDFVSVLQYDGLPLDATTVVDGVLADRATQEGARMSATIPPPRPEDEPARPAEGRLRGGEVDPLPRLRPRRHHEADRQRLLRDGDRAPPRREVLGDRLLLEDAGLLPEPRLGLQRRPRPDALGRDRRARRELRARRHRRLGRRRHGLDRHRAVRPPRPPEHAARLHRRGQRRLRPDEGAVLGDGRRRREAEERRRERLRPDRLLLARHRARRHLRRPLLLGRHEAAPDDPRGGPRPPGHLRHRRHLPLRHVQRPRGLDEELQVVEGARDAGPRDRLRPLLRGDARRDPRRRRRRT